MVDVNKKKLVLLCLAVFFVTFGLGTVLGNQINTRFFGSLESQHLQGKAVNILLMGIDARDTESNSRSDTMMVVSIDPETKNIAIVSIPRDTRIKDADGKSEKINAVNYEDGPEAACETVSDLLDTDINEYVVTNFEGFAKIVDILGGVDIYVEDNMVHEDPINPQLAINITKGQHHMDGQEALNYVRYRGGPTADIGRTQRQQAFVKAVVKEMFKTQSIVKLPELIPQIAKYVHTNISLKDMIYLATVAKDFEQSTITAQTLPGYPVTDPYNGASYWDADKDKARIIIASLLAGEKFDVVTDPPANVTRTNRSTQSTASTESAAPAAEESGTDGSTTDTGQSGESLEPSQSAQEDETTSNENNIVTVDPGQDETDADNSSGEQSLPGNNTENQ